MGISKPRIAEHPITETHEESPVCATSYYFACVLQGPVISFELLDLSLGQILKFLVYETTVVAVSLEQQISLPSLDPAVLPHLTVSRLGFLQLQFIHFEKPTPIRLEKCCLSMWFPFQPSDPWK